MSLTLLVPHYFLYFPASPFSVVNAQCFSSQIAAEDARLLRNQRVLGRSRRRQRRRGSFRTARGKRATKAEMSLTLLVPQNFLYFPASPFSVVKVQWLSSKIAAEDARLVRNQRVLGRSRRRQRRRGSFRTARGKRATKAEMSYRYMHSRILHSLRQETNSLPSFLHQKNTRAVWLGCFLCFY